MTKTEQKSLTLIMARELASNLATPLFIVDAEGVLVFYNEPAEALLGRPWAEAGDLTPEDWATLWHPTDMDGNPLHLGDTPLGAALREKRPAHARLRITSLDDTSHVIQASAFPLFARRDEFSGAVAVFWEESQEG